MRTMRKPWKASGRRGRRMLMFSATGMCGAIRKPSTATAAPNPTVPIKACLRNRRRSKSLGSLAELLHYRGRFSCGADTLVREACGEYNSRGPQSLRHTRSKSNGPRIRVSRSTQQIHLHGKVLRRCRFCMYEAIRSLKELPQRGRPGREDGTRELLFPPTPYIAVYRVKEQSIEVLRIYHAAQDRL